MTMMTRDGGGNLHALQLMVTRLPSIFARSLPHNHTQYYEAPPALIDVLGYMNSIFTMFFSLECILKLAAFGIKVSPLPPHLFIFYRFAGTTR